MLTYKALHKKWQTELSHLFAELSASGAYRFFHPHPLTAAAAEERVKYQGKDLYFLQFTDNTLCGYGFLRGWDEGYDIPSLGLAIHPLFRGRGLGTDFIHFLHEQARQRGAARVRLTVDRANKAALDLYKRLGYSFKRRDENSLLAFIEI